MWPVATSPLEFESNRIYKNNFTPGELWYCAMWVSVELFEIHVEQTRDTISYFIPSFTYKTRNGAQTICCHYAFGWPVSPAGSFKYRGLGLILTWISYHLDPSESVGRNYSSTPKLQWCSRWIWKMDSNFHPIRACGMKIKPLLPHFLSVAFHCLPYGLLKTYYVRLAYSLHCLID